jgi:hypothetical protein
MNFFSKYINLTALFSLWMQTGKKVDSYIKGLLATQDDALLSTLKSIEDSGMANHRVSANQENYLVTEG